MGIIGIVFTYILLQNKKMALFTLAFIMIFFYTIKDGFSGFSYPQFNWLLPGSSVVPYIRNAVGAVIGCYFSCSIMVIREHPGLNGFSTDITLSICLCYILEG